jgi:circadian clock protein KaiC
MNHKVKLGLQATGVLGLDVLLGGGPGGYSFNVIAGAHGGGETSLAHQIIRAPDFT